MRRALASRRGNKRTSVLLLRAAPSGGTSSEFSCRGQRPARSRSRWPPCATVLAVLAALRRAAPTASYLVVLTRWTPREVGDSVLARAMQPEIKPVNRWDLVQDAFGASRLDPALTRGANRWVAEALLDAQPAGGWRRLAGRCSAGRLR